MDIEEIPSDELVKMTSFWHKAFNIAGCDPMCHCCEKIIPVNAEFKLSTIFEAPNNCLHFHEDLNELQIKALNGEQISVGDLKKLKEDFFFEEYFKEAGGLDGVKKMVEPICKDVMLCSKCTTKDFKEKEIKELENKISVRDEPKGGCFRVNGKIIH